MTPRGRGDGRGARARRGVERECFIVQAMVEGGVELLVGRRRATPSSARCSPAERAAPQAELLKDVAVRICPLDTRRRSADAPLARDLSPADRLPRRAGPTWGRSRISSSASSAMVEAHHEIAELDLNPVLAGPDGRRRRFRSG